MEKEIAHEIKIRMDTKGEVSISEVSFAFQEIETKAESLGKSISRIVGNVRESISEMGKSLISVVESMHNVAEKANAIAGVDMNGVVTGLDDISKALNNIKEQMVAQQTQDLWTSFMETGTTLVTTFAGPIYGAYKNGGTGDGKYLKKRGKYLSEDSGRGGKGILGVASSTDPMIAGVAELIDLWDSEAAAKALSTAATTAWNAVCSVGTTIAGAFGAAINFLTSPIGVVVMAITALIAIIVLLVANWDTVKAALITGWETVKAFLGTAAEWFNTTVIQPVVTFLTALWTRITTFVSGLMVLLTPYIQQFMLLVQTVISNIQTFFSDLGAYLAGVFSVNWADQFGAFGEVLNVFFAAVQEIWTAVQTIFEGVIQFVTGVFSGDWESAWNGIVTVFTGIWEGLEAAIKTPVNGVIGLINGLVKAVVSGINGAIDALNTLRFTVPDWVPDIGGQYFGFNIPRISAPQIPYLARGAVLPANRPFLAVVGDQKHGTNVEAPHPAQASALASAETARRLPKQTAKAPCGLRKNRREVFL